MQFFQGPQPWLQLGGEGRWIGADHALWVALTALVRGKLFSCFAFLFGLGLALQHDRAEARGVRTGPLLTRRLLVLGGFGLVHSLAVWFGDVLLPYALLGLAALPLRRLGTRTLLAIAAGVLAVTGLVVVVFAVLAAANPAPPSAGPSPLRDLALAGVEAFRSGSFPAMVAQRVREVSFVALAVPLNGPILFALVLAGMATARTRLVRAFDPADPLLGRVAAAGLGVGLPVNLAAAWLLALDPAAAPAAGTAGQVLLLLGQPVLALGYLAAGARLLGRTREAAWVERLAAVGRMALSNYLLQTVIGTSVYYWSGLYGRGSLVSSLWLVGALWTLNLTVSPWWLARHEQGPVEALWRRLTYGRAT